MVKDYGQEEWPQERWPNFSPDELRCKETGELVLCEDMMDALQQLRWALGSPLVITSGYRSPSHSIEAAKIAKGGPGGAHTTGKAVDIACDRAFAYQVLSSALRAGFTGIGVQQKGDGRFLHLDYIRPGDGFHVPRPSIWSY
jgi:zinc D-Ala-D-Ala carboxypeptidase